MHLPSLSLEFPLLYILSIVDCEEFFLHVQLFLQHQQQ